MDDPEAAAAPATTKTKRSSLTPRTKTALMCMLKSSSNNSEGGRVMLPKSVEAAAISQFGVSKGLVRKLWNSAKSVDLSNPEELKSLLENVADKRKGNSGRKLVALDFDKIKSIPKNQRGSIKCLAVQLTDHEEGCNRGVDCSCKPLKGHSATALFRKFKCGMFKRISSAVKPSLTFANEVIRVDWGFFFCICQL